MSSRLIEKKYMIKNHAKVEWVATCPSCKQVAAQAYAHLKIGGVLRCQMDILLDIQNVG